MPQLVRAAALTNYVQIATSHGLDPWQMVRESGLSSACLDDPNLKVSTDLATRLLENSAKRSGQEAFGLLMVEGRRISNLGVMGLLTREEPTLRHALKSTKRYRNLHNESLVQRVDEFNGVAVVMVDLMTGHNGYTRQGIEMVIGVLVRLIKVLLGADWQAKRVCFIHAQPEDCSVHKRVLGQMPEFNAEFNGIVCTSADLDTPIASADPVMSDVLRNQLEVDTLGRVTVTDEVRHMIMLLMPRGRCTAEQIARLMGVNRRTLYRHLGAEHQSYAGLLQELRVGLSQQYVSDPRRSLRDVANLLGFGELSSFSRWYKTSFGVTAESTRHNAQVLHDQGPDRPLRKAR